MDSYGHSFDGVCTFRVWNIDGNGKRNYFFRKAINSIACKIIVCALVELEKSDWNVCGSFVFSLSLSLTQTLTFSRCKCLSFSLFQKCTRWLWLHQFYPLGLYIIRCLVHTIILLTSLTKHAYYNIYSHFPFPITMHSPFRIFPFFGLFWFCLFRSFVRSFFRSIFWLYLLWCV